MPISTGDLEHLTAISLSDYVSNKAISQIAVETPLLKKLMAGKKKLSGGLSVKGHARTNYGSNFAWTYGEAPVSFNRRRTTEPYDYDWKVSVDGFYIDTDFLFSNGIEVIEGGRDAFKVSRAEKLQLQDYLAETQDAFITGYWEKLAMELHRDGSSGADALVGLDAIVSTTPATGTVGGIDRTTKAFWRNHAQLGIDPGVTGGLARAMEEQWRNCIRSAGGKSPDFILAGSRFIDAYRQHAVTITNNANAKEVKTLDAGVGSGVNTGLFFKGVEIIWDPQFSELDALDSPATPWENRCYLLNAKSLELRGDTMNIVQPTRPYNIRAIYTMIQHRLSMVGRQPNANAVLAVAA